MLSGKTYACADNIDYSQNKIDGVKEEIYKIKIYVEE